MGVRISELATDAKLPDNDSLLEVSEKLVPFTGYASKRFTREALTKRVYFDIDVNLPAQALTTAKVSITTDALKRMCDFDNIVEYAGPSYDPFYITNLFGTLEIAAVAYEKSSGSSSARSGSSLSQVVISATTAKVRTFAAGEIPAVENTTRSLPDSTTYTVSGTNSVYPIVAAVNYGPSFMDSLEITFNLIWDDYTATPQPIKISGHIDVNLIPQLLYSPA